MEKKQVLKKILKYIEKYKLQVIFSVLFAAINAVFVLYVPVLTGDAVDCIITKGNVDFKELKRIVLIIFIVVIIAAIALKLMNVCNNYITYNVIRDIRRDAFEKLEHLPLSYIDNNSSGDICNKVINNVDTFADGLLLGFTQLFTGIITILGTIAFMLSISIPVTVAVLLITPLSLVVAAFISAKTYNMFKLQTETAGEETAFIDEMIGEQKVVKAFVAEKQNIERFSEINEKLAEYSLKATFYSSLTNPSTRFINSLVYATVAVCGAILVLKEGNAFTVGMLTSFLSYASQYTKPFNEISSVVTEMQNALACAAKIFELIDEEAEIAEKEDAMVLENAEGRVTLKDVDFSYVKDKRLIENLNINVEPGMRVAIVGPTGCGKSTIINLLMRFYDVDKGSVNVDGHDIRDITRKSLRDNYGMVLQETWLKTGTIRENICMGNPDVSEEEMIAAAKSTHAHSFIKRLKEGYDTYITEDGGSLSNGQKQLLCITRVVLSLPPMLILDEATSSIDTKTELHIQHAFARMMKGRTSFVVAHRLSTIKESDIILVMKDGHIIEQGNHVELLKKGGFYSEIYNAQYATVD